MEVTYSRAFKLCQQVGGTKLRFPALWGLWHFYLLKSEFAKATTLAEQLISLAHTVTDPVFFSDADRARGETFLWSGEFIQARTFLEKGIDLDDARQQHSYIAENPGVACRSLLAIALWLLGYPDQALLRSQEAVAMAQDLSHPLSLSFAHHFEGQLLMQMVRDKTREPAVYDDAETCFLRAIKLAQQQDAKSLELRAAISLNRLWQSQGKKAKAFGLLSKIFTWFEEGFDTPDLTAAKVLLEELS